MQTTVMSYIYVIILCFIYSSSAIAQQLTDVEHFVMFSIEYGKSDNELSVNIPNEFAGEDQEPRFPSGPCDFIVDNEENIYFSDCGNWKVKKFNKHGQLLFSSKFFDGIETGGHLWGNDMRLFLSSNNLYIKVGTRSNTLVKIDLEKGDILGAQIGTNNIFDSTHYGRIACSSMPGCYYSEEMPATPYFDKYGKEHIFTSNNNIIQITVNYYGVYLTKYIINAQAILSRNNNINISYRGFYIDEEGRYYLWGLIDKKTPIFIDELGMAEYSNDIIVYYLDSKGKILNEMVFIGGSPFGGPGGVLHNPINFASNGDVYTIVFELDKLNVVKYTWEHNKNKNENVSE
jgi:hypothetical protein